MKTVKLLTVIMALCLVLAIFASCGTGGLLGGETTVPDGDGGETTKPNDGDDTYPTPSEGLEFTLNSDGTCYVSGIGTCTDTNIVIPKIAPFGNTVTSIGSDAFHNCSSLESIEIPDSVTSIGSHAFFGCTSLTSVVIGNSVTSIGSHAFYGCTSLTSITIPDSVTSIGSNAFRDCTSLTSVVIGNSVTSIGNYAFAGCTSLKTVYYTGSAEDWASISIDSSNYYLTNANIIYNYNPEE